MITATCKSCGYSRDFEDKNIGRRFKCPKCAASVVIGAAEDLEAEQSEEAAASGGGDAPIPVDLKPQSSGSGKWGLWIMAAIIGAGAGTWYYFNNHPDEPEYFTIAEDSLRIQALRDSLIAAQAYEADVENEDQTTEPESTDNAGSVPALTYDTEQAITARIMDYFECYNHSVDCFRSFYADQLTRVYGKYNISAEEAMQEHINYYKVYPYQEATVDQNSITISANDQGNFETSFTLETRLRKQPEEDPKIYTSTVYLTFTPDHYIISVYNKGSRRVQ